MLRPPSQSITRTAFAIIGMSIPMAAEGLAQNFTTRVADLVPLGLGGISPLVDGMDFGFTEGLKGGFSYGIAAETVYDSNFFLEEDDTNNELTANLTPRLTYVTDPEGGARVAVVANYLPTFRAYVNNSDLNGVDHTGDISARVAGAKTEIVGYFRYNEVSATDRLTGQFINGSLINSGLDVSYQVAPRTSLYGSLTASSSDYGTSAFAGSDIYTARFGGKWSATDRFRFGPSIQYTQTESDNTGSRDAWALLMEAEYRVGERIQIIGSAGLEHATVSRSSEDDTLGFTGGLTANYALTERWMWTSAIRYVTVPSPAELNYVINNLTVSTGLDRQLLRANVGFGLELNISDYEGVGPVGVPIPTEDNFSAFMSYRRTLFTERLIFESRLRYSVNDGQEDWEQVQLSAALQLQF